MDAKGVSELPWTRRVLWGCRSSELTLQRRIYRVRFFLMKVTEATTMLIIIRVLRLGLDTLTPCGRHGSPYPLRVAAFGCSRSLLFVLLGPF